MILYNEIEPYAADWLTNLAAAGHVAPGLVERRSIVDLKADDLVGVTQFHAFAGIGCWSRALRLAGWPDDLEVWTGSCPCQPFSASGRKKGFDDARHLWPEWFRLIRECRPPVVFGEQVASPDGLAWFDAVSADLEGEGYAVGAADLCAAGVGAPHIRQRLYFVALRLADDDDERPQERLREDVQRRALRDQGPAAGADELSGRLADGAEEGRRRTQRAGGEELPAEGASESGRSSAVGRLVDTGGGGGGGWDGRAVSSAEDQGPSERFGARRVPDELVPANATSGPWRDAVWWYCRDGKIRPAKSDAFPLASGYPGRVGQLRAIGNTIVPEVAATFIASVIDLLTEEA